MENKLKELFDYLVLITLVILTVSAIILFLLFEKVDAEALPIVEEEKLTFEEVVKHDEEVAFEVWQSRQTEEPVEVKPEYLIEVSDEDIALMARVVMSECSVHLNKPLGDDVAQAIATTIVNRVRSDKFPNTVAEVVYTPNAYSTQDNGEPTTECYLAVEAALKYEAFPTDMYYFRENCYHSFGYGFTNIGTTYFTCEENPYD